MLRPSLTFAHCPPGTSTAKAPVAGLPSGVTTVTAMPTKPAGLVVPAAIAGDVPVHPLKKVTVATSRRILAAKQSTFLLLIAR
jgi:hypothetical protein